MILDVARLIEMSSAHALPNPLPFILAGAGNLTGWRGLEAPSLTQVVASF